MHTTLIDALLAAAKSDKGIHFVESDSVDEFLSYKTLLKDAKKITANLQVSGLSQGDEVVFQFWSLKNFVKSYWACLLGGFVPVPLALAKQPDNAQKLFLVWQLLDSPWLVTDDTRTTDFLDEFAQDFDSDIASLSLWRDSIRPKILQLSLQEQVKARKPKLPKIYPRNAAFIQFSSGSTGSPKGVLLTHENLLANIYDLLDAVDNNSEDVYLSWKPISHDFGMIAFHIAPVVAACTQIRIPMETYLWSPVIWFQMVHKFRATILGSPNFGYRHFLKLYKRRSKTKIDWDLSCVKTIINGAEPISASLCHEFLEEMSQYGLNPETMRPGYGLAEASLVVSLSKLGDGVKELFVNRESLNIGDSVEFVDKDSEHAMALVDCGPRFPATEIRITDANRQALEPGRVGHIEIRGKNVTQTYYKNPQATARAINNEGWVNTEDLGFLHNDRLVFASRIKEMIILGGINYFPHDIEKAILRVKGEDALNQYVACSVPAPAMEGEQLVVFVYYKKDLQDFQHLIKEISKIIATHFGISVSYVVPTRSIPKTTSGKVQRYVLRQQFLRGDFSEQLEITGQTPYIESKPKPVAGNDKLHANEIKARLFEIVCKLSGREHIQFQESFFDLGLSSLSLMTLREKLEKTFKIELDTSAVLDYPTIDGLTSYITHHSKQVELDAVKEGPTPTSSGNSDNAIAVIGMACRFPGGVGTPGEFWNLLNESIDPVSEMPAQRWQSNSQRALATREVGYLENIDQFDPYFFGISPAEAESMDPQQRLLLEICHEVFENAGYQVPQLRGSNTGVFLGISGTEYAQLGKSLGNDTGAYTYTGTMFNTAAGRIAYTFGLQGPCVALDTACSSSLTAVHLGASELKAGNCDLVVAAAVGLMLTPDGHVCFSQMNALSPSGRSRSFDDEADGYIRSEGCAAVALKRLRDAERDGDNILAVIRGSAINHNGRSGGLTVPNGQAQESLINAALRDAGVSADRIQYIEAHGSGTRLGDPQEVSALNRVFKDCKHPLYLGSVKSNIGHLEAAAGLAGLQKVVLSLSKKRIPANLHFCKPNTLIDWDKSPLRVVDKTLSFDDNQDFGYAGITSLGINGSNAHLVLEAYTKRLADTKEKPRHDLSLFTLSAPSEAALRASIEKFLDANLGDTVFEKMCRATQFQRSAYSVRYACLAKDHQSLRGKLEKYLEKAKNKKLSPLTVEKDPANIVFMFTGQGSIYPGVAKDLYHSQRVFREQFDLCAQKFLTHLNKNIVELLLQDNKDALTDTAVSQAAIFSVEYALAKLWTSLGIEPIAVLGHSIGEYAAACFCDVFTLEEAVEMVAARGRAMQQAPDGLMLGVLASEQEVRAVVDGIDDLHIAAINAPANITVSGSPAAVEKLTTILQKKRIFTEALNIRQPFHSPLMLASIDELEQVMEKVRFKQPKYRFLSTQNGQFISDANTLNKDYWCRHLCEPVRFMAAIETLTEHLELHEASSRQSVNCFIEIGGTATLVGLAAQIELRPNYLFLPSLREGRSAWMQWNETLAQLYLAGVNPVWESYHEGQRDRLSDLPNTGFARERYWFKDRRSQAAIDSERVYQQSPEAVVDTRKTDTGDIQKELVDMISDVTGVADEDLVGDLNLFSLGIDSLMLVQLDKRIQTRFGVEISLAQFFSELHTPEKLACYIKNQLPKDFSASLCQFKQTNPDAQIDTHRQILDEHDISQNVLLRVEQQLAQIQQQISAFGQSTSAKKGNSVVRSQSQKKNIRDMVLVEEDLTPKQRALVSELTNTLVTASAKSKDYAQTHRQQFADWIATLNFTMSTKEFTYPLVAERSSGSRFWDIDGNEYIDTAMGYGVCLFGHNPEFVTEAIQEQLGKGIELGPQSALAGELAKHICELTGVERVAFANTGSEAVMVALRLARAVTRRDKIVRFVTSFHGSFDGILAEIGEHGSTPMAPGIVQSMVDDTLVMQYGSETSLEKIASGANEIAAVLVEPVQSRNPGLQPAEYLKRLRELTERHGIALIFDEMITGFRIHPGGAQAYFDVRADIVTYGKIIGGGMPIGVIAGKRTYLDAIDGGYWEFGDKSVPSVETTFFAGTFCKHPLTMAASLAVARKLKELGPELQTRLNNRTAHFCDRLNTLFQNKQVPITVKRFASMYRLESGVAEDMPRHSLEMNLFFRLLQKRGIYVWERRTCFISTAHSDSDLDCIVNAIELAIDELRAGGFGFRSAQPRDAEEQLKAVSPEESRMYVLSQMQGGDLAYRISGALRVLGDLDAERLQQAFDQLAKRHEVLHSSYLIKEGSIKRKVNRQMRTPPVVWHEYDQAQGLKMDTEVFNLEEEPLWRAKVLELSANEHILQLEFHHLIADGVSMSIFVEELADLYEGKTLDPVGKTYEDYVHRELHYLSSDKYAKQLVYWRTQFSQLPEPLLLPTDRIRSPINDFAGESYRFVLDSKLVDQVHEVSKHLHTTTFVTLFSIYAAWLHKLTQQEDLCIGIPFDGRGGDFANTLGMFAQTLAIKVNFSPRQTFSELVANIANTCASAFENSRVPLEKIIENIDIPRDPGRNPLFDTLFIYENGDRRFRTTRALSLQPEEVDVRASAFDLTIEITEQAGELRVKMIFATRLFTRDRITQWAKDFTKTCTQLLDQPESRLAALSDLSPEQVQELDAFNGKTIPVSEYAIQGFLNQVARTPDARALSACDRELSYQELATEVDRLATRLLTMGVKPNEAVGISLPRDSKLIVAMLAVLRCGACYIPLDPAYPPPRIQYMLDHARVDMLISNSEQLHELQYSGKTIMPDEAFSGEIAREFPKQDPENRAYIIYTSGSTGKPKGVVINQKNLGYFLSGITDAVDFPTNTVALGLTTVSFDIFVLEVFATLTRLGGCLVLATEEEQQDPARCIRKIHENKVNVVQLTPSRLKAFLAGRDASEVFASVERVLVGGEAFPAELLKQLQSVDGLRIFNVYGPTEATVWATCAELTNKNQVTLGKPLANVRAYVLGAKQERLPGGQQGELYLAGNFVAAGYLHDEERTRQSFYPDPFAQGQMMYRTGDMASFTDAGELLYHGRRDHQVKLRGYRIELPEIESSLTELQEVVQAAVVKRELTQNNPVLVAFCTSTLKISSIDFEQRIRQQLRQVLPEYMVPTIINLLDDMPLTPNGKIDRNRLPQHIQNVPGSVVAEEAAEDELLKEIRQFWTKLLGVTAIGRHVSFFDVGGTSFSLLLLQNEINMRWPGLVQVSDLFANPNIQSQRDLIATRLQGQLPAIYRGISVPGELWQVTDNPSNSGVLAGASDSQFIDNLKQFSQANNVDTKAVLLAFLALYLHKKLSQNQIYFYLASPANPGYQSVHIDFTRYEQLIDVVRGVTEQSLKNLHISVPPEESNRDQLLILIKGMDQQAGIRHKRFDLLISIAEDLNRATDQLIRVDFNASKINQNIIREWINDYLKLIKVLVAPSKNKVSV